MLGISYIDSALLATNPEPCNMKITWRRCNTCMIWNGKKLQKSTIFDEIFEEICIFADRKMAFLTSKCCGAYSWTMR